MTTKTREQRLKPKMARRAPGGEPEAARQDSGHQRSDRVPTFPNGMPAASRLAFATTVACCVLGLFGAQSIIPLLGQQLGLGDENGLVATLPLLGYAIGLLLLVPLADLLPIRPLVTGMMVGEAAAAAMAAGSSSGPVFLTAVFLLGLFSCVIQMLVPAAAALVPEDRRGRTIGDIMSGLMLGIMLSRPAASVLANFFGWRSFYGMIAVLVSIQTALVQSMVRGRGASTSSYPQLIASLGGLLRRHKSLRRSALQQSLLMAAFNCFWTSVAFLLHGPPFELGGLGIAAFALAGAGGAIAAPLAGRLGDAGRASTAMRAAPAVALIATTLAAASDAGIPVPLLCLVFAACLLDAAVITDQALGRRQINLLEAEARGRLNGLYTGLFFFGSAFGSLISTSVRSRFGWAGVCTACALLQLMALWVAWRPEPAPSEVTHTH